MKGREGAFRAAAIAALLLPVAAGAETTPRLGDAVAPGWTAAGASLALVVVSWFIVLLAENCRIPFDDPNTHLELTMIHEVMVLDHSGPAFGMILYGAAALKVYKGAADVGGDHLPAFLVGSLVSFLSALLVVGPFVRFLRRHTFVPFAIYRLLAGIALLVLCWSGYL